MENKKLHAAINAVMNEVRYIKNDKTVGFGGSSYKSISDERVRELLQQALTKNQLTIMQTGIEKELQIERWEDQGKTKQQITLTVIVTYKLTHAETGESEYLQSIGIGVDPQDKSAGKAMTYALKYALLNLFLIPTGEDSDQIHSDTIEIPQVKRKPELLPDTDRWNAGVEAVRAGKITIDVVIEKYDISADNLITFKNNHYF